MDQIHYAVDIKTKAHRALEDHERLKAGERLVIADADGWIKWHGGECPLPERARTEFTRRGHGGVSHVISTFAGAQRWDHRGFYSDIIAYRPIVEPRADQTKGWRGPEDGLPPVGTVCEYRLGDSVNWFACKIVMHVGTQGTVMERSDIFEGIQYCSANGNQAVHFRPIRTDRERWIDRACAVEYCMPDGYQPRELLEALYDTGLARLPEDV